MRRRIALTLAVSTSFLVAACGGEGKSPVVPAERLDAALLTIDDFDDGWSEDRRSVFSSRDEGPQSLDPTGWCPQALRDVRELANIETLAGDSGAAVEFRHEREDARRMFEGVSQQVWSNENVAEYVDVVSRSFEACMGQTWSPEADQKVTISRFDTPSRGDESFAVNIVIVTPGPDGDYEWSSRLAVVSVGSSLMLIRDLDVQLAGGEPFMSDDEWTDLVDVAVDRFVSVVGASSNREGFLVTEPFFAN